MFMVTLSKKSLRRAGLWALCGVVCCGAFMGVNYMQTKTVEAGASAAVSITGIEDVQTYFTGYGLAIDMANITADKVKVPRSWDDSFSAFNGVVLQSGQDLSNYKGKTVEKWVALVPANSTGKEEQYAVLLVYKEKVAGAYLLWKPSGTVVGLTDAVQTQAAQDVAANVPPEELADEVSGDPVFVDEETQPQEEVSLDVQLELDSEGYPVE